VPVPLPVGTASHSQFDLRQIFKVFAIVYGSFVLRVECCLPPELLTPEFSSS